MWPNHGLLATRESSARTQNHMGAQVASYSKDLLGPKFSALSLWQLSMVCKGSRNDLMTQLFEGPASMCQ